MTLAEALDEIRRRDDIIGAHAAIEEELRRQITEAQVLGYRYGCDHAARIVRDAFRCDEGERVGTFNGKIDLAKWGRELSDEIIAMGAGFNYALAPAPEPR